MKQPLSLALAMTFACTLTAAGAVQDARLSSAPGATDTTRLREPAAAAAPRSERAPVRHTAAELLAQTARPIVIGHEGDGENYGADPTRPINDTLDSVRLAFRNGASVVEVDAELTRDKQVVCYHDNDFLLPDFTCIDSLKLEALQDKVPYIPTLEAVLEVARQVNQASAGLKGIVVIELKPPSPLCDPGDRTEQELVARVLATVRKAKMQSAVILDSGSPALLQIAMRMAPEIPRELDFYGLQFLTPAQILAALQALGYPVTDYRLIAKRNSVGLAWGEAVPIFRLPLYSSVAQVFGTAAAVGAGLIGPDAFFMDNAASTMSAGPFVAGAHGLGFKVVVATAKTVADFDFFASFGVDLEYCDDLPGSLAHQPPLP